MSGSSADSHSLAYGVRRAAQAVRASDALTLASRVGLAGRGAFYLVLTYLVVRIGAQSAAQQADVNGVFHTVTAQRWGTAALVVAVVGVVAFGVARIAAGVGDRRVTLSQRIAAAGQGCFYLVFAAFSTYFLISAAQPGSTQVGSEHTHRSGVGTVLAGPAGRSLLVALGVVVVALCLRQVWNALRQDYVKGIADEQMPGALRWLLRLTGTVGIAVRAAAILPLGVLLIIGAVTGRARRAKGLDAILHDLAGHWWGLGLLGLMATGFGLFAIYSFLEAGYRDVSNSS